MQSRFSRQFCSWSSGINLIPIVLEFLLYQSRQWRISKRAGETGRSSSARKSTYQKYSPSGRIEESPGRCELTNSPEMNWEQVTLRYRSSLQSYKSCKKEWLTWMIPENLKISSRFAVENYPTFPVSQQSFQVLDPCWAKTRSDTWNLSGTQGNVFGYPRAVIDSSQIPYQVLDHSTNQSATGGNPRAQ